MATTAKKKTTQGVLPAVEAHDNVVAIPSAPPPPPEPVAGIVPRCSCYDYDDGDEYRAPKTKAEVLLTFVADLLAHGAKLTVKTPKSPNASKPPRRRAG